MKRLLLLLSAAAALLGCQNEKAKPSAGIAPINMDAWNYNAEDDVYYQVGISYAASPADSAYESLGIFVPGKFFKATRNADGTFSVTVDSAASVGGFTAESAPFVMPIQTPGYAALEPPKEYVPTAATYTREGFVFVYAGARGRSHGAPSGIVDFKAAIRYVRKNKDRLPGNSTLYFTYGMSGGGAQSALMGATGDAEGYTPYLKAIGAVMDESDAVFGSEDWCPITNLHIADEAYEWELGTARTGLDSATKALSDSLAVKFAEYVNRIGLKDENGNALTLSPGDDGLYHAGSYYDYLQTTIEKSLNDFLADTRFPYSPEAQKSALGTNMMPTGNSRMEIPKPRQGENGGAPDIEALDGVKRNAKSGVTLSGTYSSVEDYIAALNANETWVLYDKASNTAKITSVEAFMRNVKELQKGVSAFDDLNGTQPENELFGTGNGKSGHFDAILAKLLTGTERGNEIAEALEQKDALGFDVAYRMNLYNPMYYLHPAFDGYKKSHVAKYWRINAGIFQGDTPISTELSYALALKNYGEAVADVQFFDVWGLHHTEAERSSVGDGTSTGNFIAWVKACAAKESR